ncbi:MAG: asparagine synthase (glutamine-hydrolyzing) [Chloroflexi bacterium]|nr:asparagine synthase (glutamine-hydrolyzing) [Chloroflexota bacterium]
MCGITGIYQSEAREEIQETTLRRMLGALRHRGPDQFGVYLDERVGLGSARLSIIDLSSGQQPISNEDETLWIVFNGEIFNYVELRPELEQRGHHFTTNTDTEVVVHLYEEYGPACLQRLNGQFAIALWDSRKGSLFLARDRLGIRPLFYTLHEGALIFASEIKSILAEGRVRAEIDPVALDQIFTYWSTLSPRSAFKGIRDVPPGHYLLAQDGQIRVERYWQVEFPAEGGGQAEASRPVEDLLEEFHDLLVDATQIRLRADVPVGAYLSGGLDSSTTAAIIRNYTHNRLDTFSIAFSDPDFDESAYQIQMAKLLGTDHHVVYASHEEIGKVFPEVIWHTETPLTRTSPAPLFLLSNLVHENGYKVVMTGEGADEFLAGYNIFKEAMIRRFWARNPQSQFRPLLLRRLYPYIADLSRSGDAYLKAFFGSGLEKVNDPYYSHTVRWEDTSRGKRFFSDALRQTIEERRRENPPPALPQNFKTWSALQQAQYLEVSVFLSQYLLSSQGDRVAMAHSVEGRFPFLDYRVVEFCNRLPADLKLRGLTEKYLLKRLARRWLPEEIWQRPKRPYRAPIQRSFFNPAAEGYVRELLSPQALGGSGYFKPGAVAQLADKSSRGMRLSETDDMALVGVISTQLVHNQFVSHFSMPAPLGAVEDVKVCNRREVKSGVRS